MITGIKHMAIAVRDVDGALKQYENVLGVSGVTRHEFEKARSSEAHFMLGAIQYQLCRSWDADGRFARYIEEHHGEGVHHICYTTDDIERELAAAVAKGAVLKPCAACKVTGAHKHSEGWVAFLSDRLTGLETEFMQVYKPGEGPDAGPRAV
ncbi:MAG TPA: VOC family protein [bacterium]|nr:VOC family protein [bacterium]